MKKKFFVVILLFSLSTNAQEIKLIQLDELTALINTPSKQLKVFNFWASWCGPCIQELPYFNALDKKNIAVYFISLDHPDDLEKAKKLISIKALTSTAYLLNESNTDKYMRAINDNWSGAIPATIFVDTRGNRHFFEQAFDESTLQKTVSKFIR